jgi:uncharacterized membrane protein
MKQTNDTHKEFEITTNRIEAFSDGVIAIIITIMVFDIKMPPFEGALTSAIIWAKLSVLLPKIAAYALSFLILGILWVNHHFFMHQVKKADRALMWYNVHLLFWMSLLPLPTSFLGEHHHLPEATTLYGVNMFMIALSFTLMRTHAQDKAKLFHDGLSEKNRRRYLVMNRISTSLYFVSIFAGYVSVYIPIAIFTLVALAYFVPQKLEIQE